MPLHHFLRLRWSEGFATASDLPPGAIGGQLESHGARCLAEANGAFVVFASHAFPSLGLVWTLVGELYLRNTGRWALFQHSIAAQSPLPSDDPEALLAQAFDRLYGPDDEGHREANVTALYTVLSETTYYDTSNDARALFISQEEALQELDEERPCIAMEVAAAVLRRLPGSFAGHDLPAGLMVLAGRPHERASGLASELGERDGAPVAPDAGASAKVIARTGHVPADFDLAFPASLIAPSPAPMDAPGQDVPAVGGDSMLVGQISSFVDPTDEEPYALSWLDDIARFPPSLAVAAASNPQDGGVESSSAPSTQNRAELTPAEPGGRLGEADADTEEHELEAVSAPQVSPPEQTSRRNAGVSPLGVEQGASEGVRAKKAERLPPPARPGPPIEATTPQSLPEADPPAPTRASGRRWALVLAAGAVTVMAVMMVQPPPPEPLETTQIIALAPELVTEQVAATPPTPCYLDEDEDEYATLVTSPTPAQAQNCKAVEVFKAGDDCDDANPRSFPGAPERCGESNTNCDKSDDMGPVECLKGAMKTARFDLQANKSESGNSVDVTVTIAPEDLCEHVKVGFGTVKPNTYGVALKPTSATVSCHLVSSGSGAGESEHKSCGAKGFNKKSISNDSGKLVVGAQCCVSEGESSFCEDIGKTVTVSYTAKGL